MSQGSDTVRARARASLGLRARVSVRERVRMWGGVDVYPEEHGRKKVILST